MKRQAIIPDQGYRSHWSPAFSLVEVTIAIGIVSFSLLAVVGLLPVGLKSIKNANEQAGAAAVLDGITHALRKASSDDGTVYRATFAGKEFSYSMGGAATTSTWEKLNLSGVTDASEGRLLARLEILQTPIADPPRPGRAIVTVAWPVQANPTWNSGNQTWNKAEGSLTMGIQFMPKR